MASNYDPSKISGTNHRDIQSLHPMVQTMANEFLKQANDYVKNKGLDGVEVKIISTLRTWAEQDALYAQGRTKPGRIVTNAQAGKSNHNWGVAFDIGIFRDGQYNPSDLEYLYKELSNIGNKIGLFWGGNWISIKDYPHYQYIGGMSDSAFINSVTVANLDTLLKYKG